MNFPFKGVIFDWAWTLLDLGAEDDRPGFSKMADFLESKGYALGDREHAYTASTTLFREQILTSRRSGLEAPFETILNYMALERDWNLTESDRKEALTVYYQTIYEQRKVFEDTLPVLEAMRQSGIRLGIVSNTTNPPFMKRQELKLFGLDSYFAFGVYSSEVPFRKPHPSIFKLAIKKMELAPEQILFVGDSYEADIVGAHGVGMATAWLNRQGVPQPAGPVPNFTLSALDDLLALQSTMAS